jgi:hypothetical protein
VNNNRKSIADLLGPWVDPNFQSGLILRCKAAWYKPLEDLTNLELATFLDQRIGIDHVLPIAKNRVESKIDDDTEYYEGHLNASIESVIGEPKQN